MTDFLFAFLFWLVYEALSLPLRLALLPLPMRGDLRRMISRLAGPPMIALTAWLAAHVGVPLGAGVPWIWFLVFLGAGYAVCRRQGYRPSVLEWVSPISDRRRWRRELFVEVFGLILFFGYLAFRRLAPDMTFMIGNSGAEKFANSMFFWSAWHARALPLEDYWLAGHTQAYYYWGHFFWAWIGRASLLPGEWIVTLSLSRLVQLSWEASYLLLGAFGARPAAAAVGAFFVAWGGNPKAVETAWKQYNWFVGRAGEPPEQRGFPLAPRYLEAFGEKEWNFQHYAFWEPSRAIEHTVTEYPAWTAILGDFHAHHLSLPWLIAFLALVLRGDRWFGLRRKSLFVRGTPGERGPPEKATASGAPPLPSRKRRRRKSANREESRRVEPSRRLDAASTLSAKRTAFSLIIVVLILLGCLAPLSNLWIFPVVVLAALWLFAWRPAHLRFISFRAAAFVVLLVGLTVALAALSRGGWESPLPEQATGAAGFWDQSPIRPLPASIRSTFGELISLWGFQVGMIFLAGVGAFCSRNVSLLKRGWAFLGLVLLVVYVWGLFSAPAFLPRNEPSVFWCGLACLTIALGVGRRPWLNARTCALTVAACLLLGGLELFYLQDRMSGDLVRYNSYFKFSYPVWPVLTAAAFMAVRRIWRRRWMRIPLILLIPFVMSMIVFGMPARTLQARIGDKAPRRPTLDAYAWLANKAEPGYDYEAEARLLAWIRRNVPPREVVVELATAQSGYSYHGRAASLAGRPVPLGWNHHEFQWRGAGAGEKAAEAIAAVEALYRAPTPEAMQASAREAGFRWVVFGKTEFEHYGPETADRILKNLHEAGAMRAAFPAHAPRALIFEFPPTSPEE